MDSKFTVPLEIKTLKNRQFEGYGSIFGNKDLGNDIVMPGAFDRTLAEHKSEGTLPMMFWMHNPSNVPGKWLDMSEDQNGLYVKGQLADTPLGNEIHTLLEMKAVSGLSIGYITRKDDYTNDGVRLLKELDLMETSIVSIPMNPKAQIIHSKARLSERGEYVPTDEELAELKRETEQFFKVKGFSKALAKTYTSNLFRESGVMPDDPGVMLDANEEKSTGAMPEERIVKAGIDNINEKLLLQDLDKQFKRIFGNG